ncbi:hybrid sensor histidine kinase/response regulator [Pseudorhodoferax sp.]|uniref:hybrid sensor histidine kinase/response regulator n=1 Tax=Pseudorhodoferax sp. TaxID=1993553 RepID=UPI002DD679CD|nr:hybrid sensor histidine kinase/response regulator [Pseudorhodoferax sp.]
MHAPPPEFDADTVLLVDDEALARKWFCRTYENEFRIEAAGGVDEALQALRQHGNRIAVVVTDYRMPQRNGLELLYELQRQHRHLVPLLCTAYADKDMAISAVNEGRVFRILQKPLEETATRQALRDALAWHRFRTRERALHEGRAMAVRETLGFLAHELNTPLGTVRGYMGALRDRYQAQASGDGRAVFTEHRIGEVIAAIDSAERRAMYCQSLVSSFVQSARDAHPGAQEEPLYAGALVRSLLAEYPFEGEERDCVVLRAQADFRLPGRRDLLYLVLCTLTKNALLALRGSSAPQLCVEFGRAPLPDMPDRPWIRFIDNGCGIPPEILARLTLEPLTTRAASGGNGMGLVFCRRVVQAIGGAIAIHSEPGQGCTVTLTFPCIEDART